MARLAPARTPCRGWRAEATLDGALQNAEPVSAGNCQPESDATKKVSNVSDCASSSERGALQCR
eukprot:3319366-Lingulodinium_polyedra.AAC.1